MKPNQMNFRLLAIQLMMASGYYQAMAQTSLPFFPTSDDFGGKAVTNLGKFVPVLSDYTLEVEATAGTSIGIGFAQVTYTPKASGKVRFVQMDGKIYVFENNVYAATLTPNYQYTEGTTNLFKNGSFESVGTQLSSGRWEATDWETWDGGTPTWGSATGDVNVRENGSFRSDGTKSIILHYKSRWLSQQMSGLEPNAFYRVTGDYWTSSGTEPNGGAQYEFWLGTSMANNDIMSFDGYKTLEYNSTKQSFSTTFQMPETSYEDVYFSFYRTVTNKVDWLDNVKMVKIEPAHFGLTGVQSAMFGRGAYAPANLSFPEGVGVDCTSSIVNPNFDDGTNGWTLEGISSQSKISIGEKWGVIAANQNHWQLFQQSGGVTGRAYQKISGLPNGKYEVTAIVANNGYGGEVSLFANSGKTLIDSNSGKTYTVSGVVVDGTLELGLDFATTGGFTFDFDTFTLTYKGMDVDGYREALAGRITSAKETLADMDEAYDSTALKNAIQNAEALGSDASASDVIAAISAIDQAVNDYNEYVTNKEAQEKQLKQFEAFLDAAKVEQATESYPGKAAFDAAIQKAETFLDKLKNDPKLDATAEQDALNAARETYYNSQYAVAPVKQNISAVDLSLNGSEKYVLRVDGKPFYPTDIQVRPDKLRGYIGWSEEEVEAAFKRAADDGFNTLSIPVYWSEVEPEKNHFDWHILDEYLGWCKKYGVKMEMLWFSWSSGGRVQWLWNYNGHQQLRTPDYVCSADGKSEFNMLRNTWEYSLDWRDTNLRSRETYVLGKVMEHIALWDANNGNLHTVVGVQLGNEARAHGANSATAAEIIDYYHNVGSAVKQSKYVTWTRLNCVSYETSGRTSANESKRNNGGTNIDFVGIDVYGTNANSVKGDISGQLGTNGKNYRMIMEIDAKDANSPLYQMAALAGNKAFDYYNLGPVDGNGLYANNGHVLTERAHIDLVRQRNTILNYANQDIALKKQGSGLYVYNYSGGNTNTESGLDGITFTPDQNSTQAIAVRHGSDEVALLSTCQGKFVLPEKYAGYKAQKGYFNADNEFVALTNLNIRNSTVTMPQTTCILLTKNPRDLTSTAIEKVVNDANRTPMSYYNLSGQKISNPGKGVYIIKYSDGTSSKVVLK